MNHEELIEEKIHGTWAGNYLDYLVHAHVFGFECFEMQWCPLPPPSIGFNQWVSKDEFDNVYYIPSYSTNIQDAWTIIEKLTKPLDEFIDIEKGECFSLDNWMLDRLGYDCCKNSEPDVDGVHGQYRCVFSRDRNAYERDSVFATGNTAPEAICKAALLLVIKGKEV